MDLRLRALQHELTQREERGEAAWVSAPKGGLAEQFFDGDIWKRQENQPEVVAQAMGDGAAVLGGRLASGDFLFL